MINSKSLSYPAIHTRTISWLQNTLRATISTTKRFFCNYFRLITAPGISQLHFARFKRNLCHHHFQFLSELVVQIQRKVKEIIHLFQQILNQVMKSRSLMKPNKLCNTNMFLRWPVDPSGSMHAELTGTRRDEPEPFVHCSGKTGCYSTTFTKGQCIFVGKNEKKTTHC